MVADATRKNRSAGKKRLSHARSMRGDPTLAEARFWHYAKNRGIGGLKFRRQVPVGPYIADFLCVEKGLIVEIDGGQHGEQDADRDAYLSREGYRVMRFWNSDVLKDMEAVGETILAAVISK